MNRASSFVQRLGQLVKADSVPEIGRLLGMARNTIYNFNNDSRYPSTEVLLRIQEKTGASIDWLLTGEGPMLASQKAGFIPPMTEPIPSTPNYPPAPPSAGESSAIVQSTHRVDGGGIKISISVTLFPSSKGDSEWDSASRHASLEVEPSPTDQPPHSK